MQPRPHPRPLALAASCGLAALLIAGSTMAAPKWVRIGVPGIDLPGSGADSAMRVEWNDGASGQPGQVKWGVSGGALSGQMASKVYKGKGGIGHVHQALITGLLPDTSYDYKVSSGGSWSKTFTFRTAPKDGCSGFTFIAGGDHRSDDNAGPNPKWASIISEMKSHKPRFVLESGDLVRDGAVEKQWTAHMKMAEALTPWVPMMTCLGNHDTDKGQGAGAYYNQLFPLPKNSVSKTRDYYAFTYGNVLVVALSTVTYADQGFAAQAKWLDEVLAKHKDKAWKILFYHHPSYTSYVDLKIADLNHPPNEKKQNQALVPIIDKHGVDVVFAGHNHFYERFEPKKAGKTVAAGQGTLYITSGGAGAFTYDVIDVGLFKIEPMKIICGKGVFGVGGGIAEGSALCSGKHHYVVLEVKGDVLTAKVLATAAQNLNTSDKNKGLIDSFTLTKKGASALCQGAGPGPDAGSGEPDAGSGEPDVGAPPADAGSGEADAGEIDEADAGATGDPDTGGGETEDAGGGGKVGQDAGGGGKVGQDADGGGKVGQDAGGGAGDVGGGGAGAPDAARGPALDAVQGGSTAGSATGGNDGAPDSGCSAAAGGEPASLLLLLVALALAVALRRRGAAA